MEENKIVNGITVYSGLPESGMTNAMKYREVISGMTVGQFFFIHGASEMKLVRYVAKKMGIKVRVLGAKTSEYVHRYRVIVVKQ